MDSITLKLTANAIELEQRQEEGGGGQGGVWDLQRAAGRRRGLRKADTERTHICSGREDRWLAKVNEIVKCKELRKTNETKNWFFDKFKKTNKSACQAK